MDRCFPLIAFGGSVTGSNEKAYYQGALVALRFMEGVKPTGRRFGADADARWSSLKGDLTTSDRIDLLIRDANAQWPEALGARTVFARRGVAEDEPFGVGWEPLDPVDAEELWRAQTAAPAPADVTAALTAVARSWQVQLAPVGIGAIGPADKLVVVGPSAIAAVLAACARGRDLDWADQVVVVATPPGHRQLAAVGAALLNSARPTALVSAGDGKPLPGRRLVASADADAADLAHAKKLAGTA